MNNSNRFSNLSGHNRREQLLIIFTLAWPTMLEQFLQTAVQYVDTAMVGSLGTDATASVGATATVNWMIGSTISAFAVGFLSYIARALGAGRNEDAKRAASQSVLAVIVVGILSTIITVALSSRVPVWMRVDENIRGMASEYFLILYSPMLFRTALIIFGTVLRSAGDTRTPMRISLVMNLINVCLNYILIYKAGLGIKGAALASAAAFVFGGVAITIALWRHPVLSPKGRSLSPDLKILAECGRVAFPNMLQRFGTSLGYVVFASLINALGEDATAAHTIANTVESAFYIPGFGMQTAAATLAGNAYGAGDKKRFESLSRTIIPLEIGLMIISGSMLFAFAPWLVAIFTKDPVVGGLSVTVLRMVALSEPFYGIPIVIEGMMQGLGRTTIPFVFNICCMWGIRIAGTFVFTRALGGGLVEAWGCMIGHNLMLCVLFGAYYFWGFKRIYANEFAA
ncbi:MATE family efflux transporter [Butyrivibrio sp. MC2013]|uniref:MATE family efflux transporter n=1 Tax=Butyrivibrio sp. MC2013 TaxID=1280686 RepID=UPI000561A2E5|nr:MATE family efflux transporter [Butyrivibrio sp. MC2013]